MAVGGFAVDGPATSLNGKITVSVLITCIVAASSGLIFGYDIGISGQFLSICFFYNSLINNKVNEFYQGKEIKTINKRNEQITINFSMHNHDLKKLLNHKTWIDV